MDAGTAYNAHSSQAKRKNRSSTNLNHLSLAPLTTKIPINDAEMLHSDLALETTYHHVSYIQGKSAPTTPSLLARSPMRAKSPGGSGRPHGSATTPPHGSNKSALSKSKSATHLESTRGRKPRSGTTTPGGHRRGPKKDEQEDPKSASAGVGRTDSDWMLRAGVLMTTETREYKGQSWLVSRVSSTSLERLQNEDENGDAFEKDRRAREELVTSRHASRRGSLSFALEEDGSPYASRRNSVHPSRTPSRSQLVTPGERAAVESYFAQEDQFDAVEEYAAGPDFVNLDEKLEGYGVYEMDTTQDDETVVRKLVKGGQGHPNSWFGNIMGWGLFSVDENDEESEEADGEEVTTDGELDESVADLELSKNFEGTTVSEQRVPAPRTDEGGWQDAAWLLSVASKVAWS